MQHDDDKDSDELPIVPVTITMTLGQRKSWSFIFLMLREDSLKEQQFKDCPEIEECVNAVAKWIPDFNSTSTDTFTMMLESNHASQLLAVTLGLLGDCKDLDLSEITAKDSDITFENYRDGLIIIEDALKEVGYSVESVEDLLEDDPVLYPSILKAKAARG